MKKKRGFIHILWGEYSQSLGKDDSALKQFGVDFDPENKIMTRRDKMDKDIEYTRSFGFYKTAEPVTVYVYGEDNYKFMTDYGYECCLVDKKPYIGSPVKDFGKHKIFGMMKAAEDYDEFVFLDFDTRISKAIDDNFWDKLEQKEDFQSPLMRYKKAQLNHRKGRGTNKLVPSGSFLYIRNKNIPKEWWDELSVKGSWSEQTIISRWLDKRHGGWIGSARYKELHEPEVAHIKRKSLYPVEDKDVYCWNGRAYYLY